MAGDYYTSDRQKSYIAQPYLKVGKMNIKHIKVGDTVMVSELNMTPYKAKVVELADRWLRVEAEYGWCRCFNYLDTHYKKVR